MTTRKSFRILAVALSSALLAATALHGRGAHRAEPTAPVARLSSEPEPEPVTEPDRLALPLHVPASSVATSPTDPFAATLAADDDLAKIAAIESAVRDGDTAALSVLASASLARSPGAAPAIIHGLARLAVQGSATDASVATHTLARWLTEERGREGRDAVGNVPNVIEALGALGGKESVDALVALLDDGAESDLALETLTVQQLAASGDPRGKAAITHFLGRVRGRASEDTFERELETEAVAAATEALERL